MKILLCFGTRPEAIKIAPLYHELKKVFDVKICVTAQHRQMLDDVLDFFEIKPNYDLDLMRENQSLNQLTYRILKGIDCVLEKEMPQLVLVHGDTTTSATVALAAFHRKIKIGHIEAGLRTYDKFSPFPEEINRQLISKIADFHFSPTPKATLALWEEKINRETILETGNTVIDALFWTLEKIENKNFENNEIVNLKSFLDSNKKIVLVTQHRRENFGKGLQDICNALLEISQDKNVQIVFPVHLNPLVKETVTQVLQSKENIFLIPPLSYPAFIWLIKQSHIIISDSGGIQEEAPSLQKPVLVTRNRTEREEGIQLGFSVLVGNNTQKIVEEYHKIMQLKNVATATNPYGDGNACKRIVDFLILNQSKI